MLFCRRANVGGVALDVSGPGYLRPKRAFSGFSAFFPDLFRFGLSRLFCFCDFGQFVRNRAFIRTQ